MKIILLHLFGATFLFFHTLSTSAQDISLLQVKEMGVQKLEGKELILNFKTIIHNPTGKRIGINIKKGKLFKDSEYMGSVKLLKKVKLGKHPEETVDLQVKVSLEKDLKLLEEGLMMMMGKRTELRVAGKLKATWFIFWKRYPFDYKENLSLNNMFR